MRKIMIASALAVAAAAVPASAQTVTYTRGVYTIPVGLNLGLIEEFEGGVSGTQYNPATQNQLGTTESVTINSDGFGPRVLQGNVPGGFTPDPDTNKYLAVGNDQSFTINLGTGVTVFSFVFGTLDSYNTLQLFFSDGTSQIRNGLQVINGPAPTDNPVTYSPQETGRVTYDTGGANRITSAVFSSAQFSAFEIDGIATAVPEPATWGMMILGFGLVGSQLRTRRSRKSVLATA